ncbi:hypothetical protein S7335_1302 [Synechococcus sp. PCC 7335]|uniref:DUF6876 family protein n=1 Tax=Synechococcus sp. (strain ATCC 29403 / PCC 7335) TaxID=91464 RepID=UPI00017EB569|nr:DUF6876 family protein [Synechococcus sp. PCC 7335]EDX82598.1 hypothetical protein S7335_1302 [Synechococcus sp. PCC 7335]
MKLSSEAKQLRKELRGFPRTVQRHRWSSRFPDMFCTDGVKYLAEKAKAYWLLEMIASYRSDPAIKALEQTTGSQVWILSVEGNKAKLDCLGDSGWAPTIHQEIPSDFPFGEIMLYCQKNIILLPSEH